MRRNGWLGTFLEITRARLSGLPISYAKNWRLAIGNFAPRREALPREPATGLVGLSEVGLASQRIPFMERFFHYVVANCNGRRGTEGFGL